MRLVKQMARFLVGGLFIFSGAIKVNDPVGTAIKLQEYFEVFAYEFASFFELFVPASLFLSVLLSVLEVILGIALLLGYQTKLNAYLLLAIIIFFTALTFYSATTGNVTDCGCFGDAIKLTPWQSFYKDIILLILIVFIFVYRNDYSQIATGKVGHIMMAGVTILFTTLAIIAIQHLPFIDFRSYAVGNHIPTLMQPSGTLQYEYLMERDGETYRFETYPTDKRYEFKSMEILNPEVQPKITDFGVWNDEGDFTENILSGNKLVIVVHNIEKFSSKNADDLKALISHVKLADVVALTSANGEEFSTLQSELGWSIPYYFGDATVLKAMIRSNPGIILLQNGTVLGKWHFNDVPEISEVNRLL
ncbi:MAG: DoxX family protein [Cyclobacteriaceae bacterium]|nr:DoxX family protein [Cyclobacteriaceae bacterium HetDA_MAG_MS6]